MAAAFLSAARGRIPVLAARGAVAVVLASSACSFSTIVSAKASKQSGLALAASIAASPDAPVEKAKRAAARMAVDEYVKSGMVVGVGSGSTIVYGIQRLAERYYTEGLDIVCVPTSFQSRQLIIQAGLPLSDLTIHAHLDVAIDGADEVDDALSAIKGGGACQTQEKLVASAADIFVIVADHRKDSSVLGTNWLKGIPLEVIPEGHVTVANAIKKLGGKPTLRMGKAKAGPVITDNGNFVIDADMGKVADAGSMHSKLKGIPGVVETGLFPGMAVRAYFGQADGSVTQRSRR